MRSAENDSMKYSYSATTKISSFLNLGLLWQLQKIIQAFSLRRGPIGFSLFRRSRRLLLFSLAPCDNHKFRPKAIPVNEERMFTLLRDNENLEEIFF